MANNDKVIINKFINVFWKWIRNTETPAQSDNEGWSAFCDSASRAVKAFEGEYMVSESLHWLFIKWMNDYLEYAGKENAV